MSPHAKNLHRPISKLPTKQHCQKVCNMILQSNPHIKNGYIYHRGKSSNEKDPAVESEHRADRYLFYLTGVEDPDYHVLIHIQTNQVYLITPTIADDEEYLWKCPPENPTQLLRLYDIDIVLEENDLFTLWHNNNNGTTTPIPPPDIIYTLSTTTDFSFIPTKYHTLINKKDLGSILDECRLIKFKWEIQLIRNACYASSQAHIALMKNAYPGQPEYELVALFKWICSRYGLSRQAYLPIVVSGKRTAVLHETRHNHSLPIDENAMVLVDAGGEQSCYSADITRCYPVTGKFSLEAKIIYEIVLKIQETVLSHLKPGIMWNDMEMLALRVLCEELCRIGILIGDIDELIELNIPTTFYYHNVHDVGGRKLIYDEDSGKEVLSNFLDDRPLEANMVITVEPGIYFNSRWIKMWTQCPGYEQFFDLDRIQQYSVVGGIRIEDTVVITNSGYENLTTVPKSVQDIENLMACRDDSHHVI